VSATTSVAERRGAADPAGAGTRAAGRGRRGDGDGITMSGAGASGSSPPRSPTTTSRRRAGERVEPRRVRLRGEHEQRARLAEPATSRRHRSLDSTSATATGSLPLGSTNRLPARRPAARSC
jgi:hypothetical protein